MLINIKTCFVTLRRGEIYNDAYIDRANVPTTQTKDFRFTASAVDKAGGFENNRFISCKMLKLNVKKYSSDDEIVTLMDS